MYNEIASNKRRSYFLVFFMFVLIVGVASALGYIYGYGYEVVILAVVFAFFFNLFGYFFGGNMALALNGARKISLEDHPQLYRTVENLSITAGLPMPSVHIIEDEAMNAFATGRDPQHSAVAFTRGLLNRLEPVELEGVVAHELSHVQNYDIRLMTLVVALVGVLMVLIDFFWRIGLVGGGGRDRKSNPALLIVGVVLIILAPLLGQLIQLAISRKREYLADASGSLLTRYPEGLASALEKIGAQSAPMQKANHATAHMFLANPFGASARKNINKFFSTHPPIEERVKRLREMIR